MNDAAGQWYQSFRAIPMQLGWEPLTFENAGFIFRDKVPRAIMALHVDDVLLAMDAETFPEECEKLGS